MTASNSLILETTDTNTPKGAKLKKRIQMGHKGSHKKKDVKSYKIDGLRTLLGFIVEWAQVSKQPPFYLQ